MFEVLRRLILGLAVLIAVVYTGWTVDALIGVRVLVGPLGNTTDAIALSGSEWDVMESALRADATRATRNETLRARLGDADQRLIDSTLSLPPDRFEYYYRADQPTLNGLAPQLRGDTGGKLRVAVGGDPARLLELSWHGRPANSAAPIDMVYPNFRKPTSLWVVLAGLAAYVVLGWIAGAQRGQFVPLDGNWLKRQTLLGLLLTGGFAWMMVMRSDPTSAMLRPADWTGMLCWMGTLAGLVVLACAGARASYGVSLGKDRFTLITLGGQRELSPGDAIELTEGPNRHEYRVRLSDRATHTISLNPALAREFRAALAGRAAPDQTAFGQHPPMPLTEWLLRRLLPALGIITLTAIYVGFLRGVEGFMVGIQGLLVGCVLGAIIGYFARHDPPDHWRVSWCFLAAAMATAVFTVAQGVGVDLALRHADVLSWLRAILNGSYHEQFWGYSRYQWHTHDLHPGPLAWVLLNLLDLAFMYGMTFVLLRTSLPTNQPDGDNACPAQ